MLEILLATLPFSLPQDPPASPAQAPAVVAPERWLPENALVALVVEPMHEGSAAAELLAGEHGSSVLATVAKWMQPALAATGLEVDDVTAMLTGGIAIGLVDLDTDLQPDVVLVAGVGDAEAALAPVLAKLTMVGGMRVVETDGVTMYLALRDGHLAIGTQSATVEAALERALTGGPSLADERDYIKSLPAGGRRLAHAFARIADVATLALGKVPPAHAASARRASEMLGLRAMHWASASWTLAGEDIVGRWQLETPKGEGLLDALAGTTGRLEPSLARFVPAAADGYGFFAVQLGTVFEEVQALVQAIEPRAGASLDQALDALKKQTGVDVRADIVGGLAGRLVTFSLPGEGTHFGALMELRQGANFARAFAKLLPALPVPLEPGNIGGVQCWRMPGDEETPALGVVGNWLVVANSDAALSAAAQRVQKPEADAQVTAFLRSLPPDAVAAHVGSVAAMAGPWSAALTHDGADLGTRTIVMRRSSDAFVFEERTQAAAAMRVAATVFSTLGAPRTVRTAASTANPGVDATAAATLAAAEAEGSTRANVTAVAALLTHKDAAVVARACWLLGEWKATPSIPMLADVAHSHTDADVRLQATSAIARMANAAGSEALTTAVEDSDPRVRTCAVQGLARLGAAAATRPLLGMLTHFGSEATSTPSDLVATLVALHDLGDPQTLLPAASAIGVSGPQTGQALAFLFQGLSPRLPPKEEATALLAVLDHQEPMLRRYAIQRLGELRDPTTSKALEGRLAAEGVELQPLLRVSLAQVRGDTDRDDDDLVARAKSNVTAISQMVERRWNRLGATAQMATLGAAGVVLLLLLGVVITRRRRRQSTRAAEAQAMVRPSTGYAASGRTHRETVGAGSDRY